MLLRTSGVANRSGWGVCERAFKLHLFRKGLPGKAKAKTGIGKSDLPGLQGGPRKRDFAIYGEVLAPRLYPDSLPHVSCSGRTAKITCDPHLWCFRFTRRMTY